MIIITKITIIITKITIITTTIIIITIKKITKNLLQQKHPTSKTTIITTMHMMIMVITHMYTAQDAAMDTTMKHNYTQLRPTFIRKSLFMLEKSLAFVASWVNLTRWWDLYLYSHKDSSQLFSFQSCLSFSFTLWISSCEKVVVTLLSTSFSVLLLVAFLEMSSFTLYLTWWSPKPIMAINTTIITTIMVMLAIITIVKRWCRKT